MTKVRMVYGMVAFLIAVLFFWSARVYVLGILIVVLLFPLVLRCLLRLECRNLTIVPETKRACRVGQNLTITLHVQGRMLFAAGIVNLNLEMENKLFEKKREIPVTIGLSKRTVSVYLPYTAKGCGQVTVRLRDVYCYDIMGLNRIPLRAQKTAVLTVYPEEISMNVTADSFLSGFREGEQQTVGRRGTDPSEVFDLREYQNGDDVRSIHWKLSEKMDKLLVKESSDTSHYSTMVLLDCGRFCGAMPCALSVLSTSVSLALTFSERLLELGILHYVGIPSGNGIFFEQVTERAEHSRVTDTWMGLTLVEQAGEGLRYFLADRMHRSCRHMIYITAGAFPDHIYMLPADLNVMALCIQERDGEVRATRKGLGVFMEIPLSQLGASVHNIVI